MKLAKNMKKWIFKQKRFCITQCFIIKVLNKILLLILLRFLKISYIPL